MNIDQLNTIRQSKGFIAALDQSGGSTPKALALYGIDKEQYSNDEEMFALVHTMRSRIITNSCFTNKRILGAILFENTMDREIENKPTAKYLWEEKNILPFLKIDKGLEALNDDVKIMKPIPELDILLARAKKNRVFGTKMRSVILLANKKGISNVVVQQFEIAKQVLTAGLMPIIEPEVDIHSEEKEDAENILREEILKQLDLLGEDVQVMLKLTLPTKDNFYRVFVDHPKVLKVVALSGGYTRVEANNKLSKNKGVIASFSRALTEELRAQQSDENFTTTLDFSIQSIYEASNT